MRSVADGWYAVAGTMWSAGVVYTSLATPGMPRTETSTMTWAPPPVTSSGSVPG